MNHPAGTVAGNARWEHFPHDADVGVKDWRNAARHSNKRRKR
jgi:hypothetical protein